MENNLAEKINTNRLVEQPDYNEEIPLKKVHPKDNAEPRGLSSLEIKVMSVIVLILFGLLLLNVQTDLQLATSSRNVQDLNHEIETVEVEVENLQQHVQELSRYDRIHTIAEEYGLTLHEDNILNLSPLE